ncbi:sulfatase-like hydrolase/transferase [Haliea sp. E17]|uniref:sulfatase-like hydrolase/transferase n=1 Tax=Haliea sp. E17 TaxID=3401576 RepID=UPI003AABE786
MPLPRITHILLLLAGTGLAGCGEPGPPPSAGAAVTAQVNNLAPLLSPQGGRIADALLEVSTLDGQVVLAGRGWDAAGEPLDIDVAGGLPEGRLCRLRASGGELLPAGGEGAALPNDTAPENLVPCTSLQRAAREPGVSRGSGIALNALSSTLLDMLRQRQPLAAYGDRLEVLLDTVAEALAPPQARDFDGDGTISQQEFSQQSPAVYGALSLPRVIERANQVLDSQLASLPAAGKRPNIVLIVADDVGYGDVGAYAGDRGDIATPGIDRIASQGARLTSFHVQPVCAATRAALLSGRYQHDFSLRGAGGPARAGIPRELTLLPEMLQRRGYATGAFGKWHLSDREGFTPPDRGFHEWLGFTGGALPYTAQLRERYAARFPLYRNGELLDGAGGHATDLFADAAIDFMGRHRQQPFFLYLAFNAAHTPLWSEARPRFSAREDWLRRVQDQGISGPRQQDYAALVQHMDARIGDLLDRLDALGIADDTLLFFLSDNGADVSVHESAERPVGSNGSLRGGKGSVYEGGLRVPMVARWPGHIPPGLVVDAFTSAVDLWPSVRDAVGIDPHYTGSELPLAGHSLLPLMGGVASGTPPAREDWFVFPVSGLAVVHPPWKLVLDSQGQRSLYNLQQDPQEQVDRAAEQPQLMETLGRRIDAYLDRELE